ncbi:YjbQ family protein [Staphylothermus hellenicus]|uniref:Uncharacterized protein n=1 Tax=Staphylothermus hellenicus (strain DSM 12710 / JCM 10830 / BK20S6-10-b1 / P8) TaxID=591019 RepID=D7DCB8_STAHD|nr:YjbQ family protein [Staphylothermus hellenicus]ADI31815.1 conserved hypothetical protein [Staphylothermus hellenicus DSM 12710]
MRIIIEKNRIGSAGWSATDLTDYVNSLITKYSIENGMVTIYTPSKHSYIVLTEYEPNLLSDLESFLEKILGKRIIVDGLLGKSVVLPIINHELDIGVFKRIVFLDTSRISGNKEVVVIFEGETGQPSN